VEKPFTWSVAQAEELIELADRKNLKIMVDHTFLFTGAVKKIKDVVEKRELGDLYYYDSLRVNLVYSSTTLMSSGISLRMNLFDYGLSSRRSRKQSWPLAKAPERRRGRAFITVYFPKKIIAHVNVNWLSP